MAATVVADRRARVVGDLAEVRDQLLERQLLQLGMPLQGLVEVVDVRGWCLPWWISIVLASMVGSKASIG